MPLGQPGAADSGAASGQGSTTGDGGGGGAADDAQVSCSGVMQCPCGGGGVCVSNFSFVCSSGVDYIFIC